MPRIGQILSQSVPLSDHDVEEILQEQKTTRQRFGDAALALGKAQPEQVWEAWLAQVRQGPIDLDRTTIDPAALAEVPAELVVKHRIVPVRLRGNELVVAIAGNVVFEAISAIGRATGLQVIPAVTTEAAIERALARCYPVAAAPAA